MITPISVNYEEREIDGVYTTFIDANGNKHEPEDVMAALNNAAAGDWEDIQRIPVPDGKQGQYLLFLYADNDVVKVSWRDAPRRWVMISGLNPPRENLVAFARINIPKKEKEKQDE